MPIHTQISKLKQHFTICSLDYTQNTQYLSMKQRHLTSVHPSNLFFYFNRFLLSKQRRNRCLFLTSAEICALVAPLSFDQYVKNASYDMKMLTSVIVGF